MKYQRRRDKMYLAKKDEKTCDTVKRDQRKMKLEPQCQEKKMVRNCKAKAK